MTEVHNGATVAVRLPGGVVSADVGPPVMGPPGLRGQRGERGDPGGTTTIVFAFSQRTPAELPDTGLIPAGWDDVRVPDADIQVGVGQSVEYRPDRYLWLFVGPSAIPGGWIETGQMRGPPGDTGPIGDTGPPGPMGDRGLIGNTGSPGPKGDPGDPGPQGARGEIGQPGTPGATGPAGPAGPQGGIGPEGPAGPLGDPGPPGPEGPQGAIGPIGLTGDQGEQGDPGAPSFIIDNLTARTASELVLAAPNGLIPANFDGQNRPPAPYQMQAGEAWLAMVATDPLRGQAIVFCGQRATSTTWLVMSVTGPQGERGEQGFQGPTGPTGETGETGSEWIISTQWPPDISIGRVGDKVLILLADPESFGHGFVYDITTGGVFTYRGTIRGPAGPQGEKGDPGDLTMADLIPVVLRLDALQARVDRLESFNISNLSGDANLADNTDVLMMIVPLTPGGDYQATANLTLELAPVNSNPRMVTVWIEPYFDAVITGLSAAQISLHGALPYGTLSIGPIRIAVPAGGVGSAALMARATPIGGGGPGSVIAKASTSVGTEIPGATAHPRASGLVAR